MQYLAANKIEDADQQRAVLLSTTYRLIRNFVSPKKPTEFKFTEIVEVVQKHMILNRLLLSNNSISTLEIDEQESQWQPILQNYDNFRSIVSQYYPTLDLANAYQQIPLDEQSRKVVLKRHCGLQLLVQSRQSCEWPSHYCKIRKKSTIKVYKSKKTFDFFTRLLSWKIPDCFNLFIIGHHSFS